MPKVAPTIVALIPARAGSKRLENKNIRLLGGHPLVAYTIAAAIESQVFEAVMVSTDAQRIAEIARHYGAEIPFLRPSEFASDSSPDIEWVEYTLRKLNQQGRNYDCFSILRPTSPFRKADTIRRAWNSWLANKGVDSLRAVERCKQHPGKMWIVRANRMVPLLPFGSAEASWHSSQYAALPEVYVQNASLEMAWSRVVLKGRTIAGHVVVPFFTHGDEGYDINDLPDWTYGEYLLSVGQASLPPVPVPPFRSAP